MKRQFPIIRDYILRERPDCPKTIDWEILTPHERQALKNHSQPLERLAMRGGLSPNEVVAIVNDRSHSNMGQGEAVDYLIAMTRDRGLYPFNEDVRRQKAVVLSGYRGADEMVQIGMPSEAYPETVRVELDIREYPLTKICYEAVVDTRFSQHLQPMFMQRIAEFQNRPEFAPFIKKLTDIVIAAEAQGRQEYERANRANTRVAALEKELEYTKMKSARWRRLAEGKRKR